MRKTPYTEKGISRIPCFRCGAKKARFQWQVCSDNNQYRGLCESCDILMNKMVLRFMGFKDWKEKVIAYTKKVMDAKLD